MAKVCAPPWTAPWFVTLTRYADVQMSEGLMSEANIKQDSTTPAPGTTSPNTHTHMIHQMGIALTSQLAVTKR